MTSKARVGVSACLLGEAVRYNAGHCRDDLVAGELAEHLEYVRVCPEEEVGLGVPRPTMRLIRDATGERLVSQTGEDITPRLTVFSRERAESLAALELDGFILKKDSPTCGLDRVRVYPPEEGRAPWRDGRGVFARALTTRMPDLPVVEEGRLRDPATREHFLTRVLARRRWREFVASTPRAHDLVAFHARHKLLLLAHDEARYRRLGRIVANAGDRGIERALPDYGALFHQALAQPATRGRQANVLQHLLGHADGLDRAEKAEILALIEEYRCGLVPLVVPARLLLHHVRRASGWAATQVWFEPTPAALRLRTHVARA